MAVEVVEFREYVKNTLQGFLTLRMTNVGLEIRDIAVHRRNGARGTGTASASTTAPATT